MSGIYDIADHETTNQALARLGYRREVRNERTVLVYVVTGEVVAAPRFVADTNAWIRGGCVHEAVK